MTLSATKPTAYNSQAFQPLPSQTPDFRSVINSQPESAKVAYAQAVPKILELLMRYGPSIGKFLATSGLLATASATIAKNWDNTKTAASNFAKWVSEQPDILQKYLESEHSKNVSPHDRKGLEQSLLQMSQGIACLT